MLALIEKMVKRLSGAQYIAFGVFYIKPDQERVYITGDQLQAELTRQSHPETDRNEEARARKYEQNHQETAKDRAAQDRKDPNKRK